jgi:hypothetical protein
MTINITIINKENEKIEELTGVSNDDSLLLVPFHFKESSFVGFWVDPDNEDIIFYVGAESFRTPYSELTCSMFKNLVK